MSRDVLVVDYNAEICEILATSLSLDQFNVTVATTAQAALGSLSEMPDVVLVEYRMPDFSCSNFIEHVQAQAPRTKIAVMSADAAGVSVALKYNVPFMIKPFNLTMVSRKLHELCNEEGDSPLGFESQGS
jgi:DNA-binding NtrC family response regulator